eukprot:m.63603 g.63603  ORF g.63603 m.63603 type:complete len:467 (-) comp23307_c0_seq1:248-1648(-)
MLKLSVFVFCASVVNTLAAIDVDATIAEVQFDAVTSIQAQIKLLNMSDVVDVSETAFMFIEQQDDMDGVEQMQRTIEVLKRIGRVSSFQITTPNVTKLNTTLELLDVDGQKCYNATISTEEEEEDQERVGGQRGGEPRHRMALLWCVRQQPSDDARCASCWSTTSVQPMKGARQDAMGGMGKRGKKGGKGMGGNNAMDILAQLLGLGMGKGKGMNGPRQDYAAGSGMGKRGMGSNMMMQMLFGGTSMGMGMGKNGKRGGMGRKDQMMYGSGYGSGSIMAMSMDNKRGGMGKQQGEYAMGMGGEGKNAMGKNGMGMGAKGDGKGTNGMGGNGKQSGMGGKGDGKGMGGKGDGKGMGGKGDSAGTNGMGKEGGKSAGKKGGEGMGDNTTAVDGGSVVSGSSADAAAADVAANTTYKSLMIVFIFMLVGALVALVITCHMLGRAKGVVTAMRENTAGTKAMSPDWDEKN